ncbi:MAG TPA: alcohol dehydrogenase catalytic domain-containing protein [Candidatus Nitrosotenuis sp.]|nr:alcohol dehydrogenase catalytic domain-containing protein [Candidatus Nitrosotenuis sp.]
MKAAFLDKNKISLVDDYQIPKSGETLVKVSLAGICGTDLEMIKGYASFSGVIGHEFVGVVVDSENKELLGKRVVGEINVGCDKCSFCKDGLERHCSQRTVLGIYNRSGAFAQYLSLPSKNLHIIPDSISDEQAVFVEPLAAAFEIEEQLKIENDSEIAIIGDGKLAQLICRVLKINHKNITCFGKHQNKLQLLSKFGILTKLGISEKNEHTFDVVIEATGSETGFTDTMRLVKPRGIVVLKSTIASKNKLDLASAIVNEITFVGSRCGPFRPAIHALQTGMVTVDDLIDTVYPLEDLDNALAAARDPDKLKVFLRP